MADPIETAAEAMDQASRFAEELALTGVEIRTRHDHVRVLARTAFASLAQYRDDLARVLHNAGCPDGSGCLSEPTAWGMYYRQVDALLAFLAAREAS